MDQETAFYLKINLVPGLRSAWTGIVAWFVRDIQYFFNSSIEFLMGYGPWARSHLAHRIGLGQGNFLRLLGASRGPKSRNRVSTRSCQAPAPQRPMGRPSFSAGEGCASRMWP